MRMMTLCMAQVLKRRSRYLRTGSAIIYQVTAAVGTSPTKKSPLTALEERKTLNDQICHIMAYPDTSHD